ncbi:hypothetical protein CerSpe_025770 [Prunus speciosa]
MLKTRFNNFPKGQYYRERFHDLLEDGICNADNQMWKEQRRVATTEMYSSQFVEHSFCPSRVLASGGSVSNSRRITETKCLLCLAKLVEKEQGELQFNCLMTIIEITVAAESNANLRRAAFKTDLPTAKAVVDQLLRLIKDVDSPTLQIPAIKSAMNTHSCMD